MPDPQAAATPKLESALLNYHRGTGTDHAGRHLDDVLAWDDDSLENIHDYIQWVFPNDTPSRATSFAPLLTREEVGEFRNDPALQRSLRRAFLRILRFYGFDRQEDASGVRITPAADFAVQSRRWLQPSNHNHLRLTRIMKCLKACGLGRDARALQDQLLELADRTAVRSVSRTTARFWRSALDEAEVAGRP